jgi:hypothetical protein
MITRGQNFRQFPLDIVGSSTFGRYPKISIQKTYNMFMSDKFMVPYAGYQIAMDASNFNNAKEGRGAFTSTKFDRIVTVMGNQAYLVNIEFNIQMNRVVFSQAIPIGTLQTSTGPVFIQENNKPQIGISDGTAFYIYDPSLAPNPTFVTVPLTFTPGYLTFHDTYFILAAKNDNSASLAVTPANNTWHISLSNEGYLDSTPFTSAANVVTPTNPLTISAGSQIVFVGTTTLIPGTIYYAGNFSGNTFQVFGTFSDAINNVNPLATDASGTVGVSAWPDNAAGIGLLQTKPDNTQAVVRFPSKGNMIFVMGSIVTEAWFDTGAQGFPYQRTNQFNIDYGCLSPATVAYMDEIVVWLAQNEKSGPIIVYSDGGMPKKITTDGIDFLFSTLQNPQDSQGFLYRQDGHLFYHINFYSDNLSLFYDFNADKFYHACDQNLNYFIAAEIAFFNNQYYFVSKNTGCLYAFDTTFYTYQDVNSLGVKEIHEIPRIRTCANVRTPDQCYEIINDLGFTIESGETDYQQQDLGEIILITQDRNILITQGKSDRLVTQDDMPLIAQDGTFFVTQQTNAAQSAWLIAQQNANTGTTNLSLPHVDLSISTDGGATFGNEWAYYLPPIGHRKNRLMWWQIGIANDFVPQFKFWGLGRFVATDGLVSART